VALVVPLRVVEAEYLYNMEDGRGLLGASTNLIRGADADTVRLNVGAAGLDGEGVPYVSLRFKLPDAFFEPSDLFFGAFAAKNFDTKEDFWGLSASMPIW